MNDIRDLKNLIILSLGVVPADINNLMKRDFLSNRSRYGIERLLQQLKKDGKIYMRRDKFYAYKKSVSLAEAE